jgi:hypothetical protein
LPRLVIRSSDIHAAGCFTVEDIPKGTRVLEYTGERITKAEGDDRYDGRPFTYSVRGGRRRGGDRRARHGHVRKSFLRSQLRNR